MQTEASSIETTRVRVIEPFLVAGEIIHVDDVVDLSADDAADVIRRGKAELVTYDAAPAARGGKTKSAA